MKQNCWEFLGCDRKECAARFDETLDGVHGGRNGGRACWAVVGTLCVPRTEARNHHDVVNAERVRENGVRVSPNKLVALGIHAREYGNCRECSFYKKVREEEAAAFSPALAIYAASRCWEDGAEASAG